MNLELLREKRRNQKKTQEDMAKAMGYSGKSGYSCLEAGKIKITVEQSVQIKQILNLSESDYQKIFLA